MSNPNYSLDIISHHPEFKNRSLKKYSVEGIETIGAWGNEPFEIRFKNNTYKKIQVKLSLDGTDILSGETANTDVTKDMWVVNPYDTLNLKAWPETHNGGAQFVFTSAEKSVAVHTHGDLSSRGIIAAAVFVEGHVEPPVTVKTIHHYNHTYSGYPYYNGQTYGTLSGGGTFSSSAIRSCSLDSLPVDDSFISYNSADNSGNVSESVVSDLVAIGAGQHVDQKISYVQGLIKPQFSETVRVRFLWWDDLVSKLKEHNVPAPHASGFPGDKNKGINLGSTPRIDSYAGQAFPRAEAQPMFSRV